MTHGRFRLARSILCRHAVAGDIRERVARRILGERLTPVLDVGCGEGERVARRILGERLTPVLDVGCGEGELARHLPDGGWVGADSSPAMLARAPEPAVLAGAAELPPR